MEFQVFGHKISKIYSFLKEIIKIIKIIKIYLINLFIYLFIIYKSLLLIDSFLIFLLLIL